MICQLCETETPDDEPECLGCGKIFSATVVGEVEVQPIAGLEQTLIDPAGIDAGAVQALPDLEQTMVARKGLRVQEERVEGVEPTRIEADPGAQSFWSAAPLDTESGREQDLEERTPAPEDTGVCPWCQAPSSGLVCDHCGRRRSRYLTPPAAQRAQARAGESVLCPACFARVEPGPRCVECGVPFPVAEVY